MALHLEYQPAVSDALSYTSRTLTWTDTWEQCLQQCQEQTSSSPLGPCSAAHWNDVDTGCTHFIGAIFRTSYAGNTPREHFSLAVVPHIDRGSWVVIPNKVVKKGYDYPYASPGDPLTRQECYEGCQQRCPNNDNSRCCTHAVWYPTSGSCAFYRGVTELEDHPSMDVMIRSENLLHNIDYLHHRAGYNNCNLDNFNDNTFAHCRARLRSDFISGVSYSYADKKCWTKWRECVNGGVFRVDPDRKSDLALGNTAIPSYFDFYPQLCAHTADDLVDVARLSQASSRDPSECAEDCYASPGCTAFEWDGGDQLCYHFGSFAWSGDTMAGAEVHERCLTGVVQNVFIGFRGPVTAHVPEGGARHSPADNTLECGSNCIGWKECRMFAFDKRDGVCSRWAHANITRGYTSGGGDGLHLLYTMGDHALYSGDYTAFLGFPAFNNTVDVDGDLEHCAAECDASDLCLSFHTWTGHDVCVLTSSTQAWITRRFNYITYVKPANVTASACESEASVHQGTSWALEHSTCAGTVPDWSSTSLQRIHVVDTALTTPFAGHMLPVSLRKLTMADNAFLRGTVPDMSHLVHLTHLKLRNNGLRGTVQLSWFPASLERINLQNQHLTGVLPDFSSFPALVSVLVGGNAWDCALPLVPVGVTHDFGAVTCATQSLCQHEYDPWSTLDIDVSDSECSGTLPDLTSFTKLTSLDLSHNRFTGLMNWRLLPPSLHYLDVSHNHLSLRSTPGATLPHLVQLDVSHNTWLCPLPADVPSGVTDCVAYISAAQKAFHAAVTTHIRVVDYTLSGPLPDLRDFALLQTLELHETDTDIGFSGEVTIEHLPTQLTHMSIRGGNLTGTVPSFAAFPLLSVLVLRGQALTGTVTAALLPLDLRVLDLSFNRLQGTLPDLSTLHDLRRVKLDGNAFSGPLSVSVLPASLRVLRLRWNALSGSLPVLTSLQLNKALLAGNAWHCPVADYSWVAHNDWSVSALECGWT